MIPKFILAWLPAANIENPDVRNIVNNCKEKTVSKNRSEDDAQNESYNEFKKNAERKVWEDNLKALEDEAKRPLFPAKDDLWKKDRVHINQMLTPLDELWKKGMVKNIDAKVLREEADPEGVREEVDSLSEEDRYDVTIYFENLRPETVGWIMEKMNSYIHIARSINITPINEPRKGWGHIPFGYDESDEIYKDYPHPEGTA